MKTQDYTSEYKESCTALHFFDALGQHALLLDSNNIIRGANRIFLETIGLTSAEIIGQAVEILEPYFSGISDHLAEVHRKDRRVFHTHVTDQTGTVLFIEVTLAHLQEQNLLLCTGRNLHTLTCGQESSLRRTEQQLIAANRLKRKFIANINHAIRTPMNAIIGYAEILAESGLNDQQRRFVNAIRKNGASLVSIINDVMELSKLETGNVKVLKSATNLRAVIGQAIDLFTDQARAKKLDFSCEVASELPEMYVMDADHCRQVLTNLISNSVKFTDKGTVTLRVTGHETEQNNYELIFRIEDSGCGISVDNQLELQKLFSEKEPVCIHDGTRLGLTLCARLARMMGGSIQFESMLGQGSAFLFYMPAQIADKSSAKKRPTALRIATTEGKKRNPVMLVVDDMPEMSHLIKIYFSSSSINVLEAADETTCLTLSQTEKPDLILMDLDLAGTDGRDIAQKLRSNPQTANIPIVVMTGLLLDKETLAPLFNDYLAKPFHLQELQRVVDRYIPVACRERVVSEAAVQKNSQIADLKELRAAWNEELKIAYLQAQHSGNLEDALALGQAMEQRGQVVNATTLIAMGREMKRFAVDMDIRGVEQILTALSKVEEEI
jgi:signal transduction histidine kinase/DNA-binding response OmpR family regulator